MCVGRVGQRRGPPLGPDGSRKCGRCGKPTATRPDRDLPFTSFWSAGDREGEGGGGLCGSQLKSLDPVFSSAAPKQAERRRPALNQQQAAVTGNRK